MSRVRPLFVFSVERCLIAEKFANAALVTKHWLRRFVQRLAAKMPGKLLSAVFLARRLCGVSRARAVDRSRTLTALV